MQFRHHLKLLMGAVRPKGPLIKKLFFVMRLTTILMFLACCHVSGKTLSQKITLTQHNASLETIFQLLERQTTFTFLYNDKNLQKSRPVTIKVKQADLKDVLEICFKDQPISYTIQDNTIVVNLKEVEPVNNVINLAPPKIIEGRVLDQTKNPIIGATILIKGKKEGTSSDIEGKFSLKVEPGDIVLISSIGYQTREMKIGKEEALEIIMEVTNESMKELVVTGLFSRSKESYTGASTSFTNEELRKVGNNNVFSVLAVLDPSFQINENIQLGSDPNRLADIVLRGGNSLVDIGGKNNADIFNYTSGPNVPLFILDGFETSLQRINDLDMNRIEKIDILKDATATAIYGSRAANGVIVIETVRPKPGKLRLNYNGNIVLEVPDLSGYDLLNAREKLDLEQKLGYYDEGFNITDQTLKYFYNYRLSQIEKGINTDWMAIPLRMSVGQKHNVFVEGGTKDVVYGFGGTYNNVLGVMKGSDRRTASANSYFSYRVNGLLIRNDFTIDFNKSNNSPYGNFSQYTKMNPYLAPYDANGALQFYLEDVRDSDGRPVTTSIYPREVNPLFNATLDLVDRTGYTSFSNNFLLQWQAKSWLRLTSRVSATKQMNENDRFLPAQHTSFASTPTFERGSYTKVNGRQSSFESSLAADINKRIYEHQLTFNVNASLRQSQSSTESIEVIGFPNPRLNQLTLGYGYKTGAKPSGTESIMRLASILASVNYNFDHKYLLDLSYRVDGSSQFGTSKRTAPFWSAGVGYNLHKERLFHNLGAVNQFKLRYSYGNTGSQNFASFLGLSTSMYFNDNEYRGVIGTYLLGYGNPMLAWQVTYKSNFGADMFFFNKLKVTANYFIENTKGSIALISTPPSVGFMNYSENMGDLEGKGWETMMQYTIMSRPSGREHWSVFFNAASAKSKIRKISNTIEQINRENAKLTTTTPITKYAEGQSTTAIWAVQSLGIDPSTGLEIFIDEFGNLTNIYNPQRQVIVGDTRADVSGSFGTTFEMNGIGLNLFFTYRLGGQAYNQTLIDRVENVNIRSNNVDRRVAEQRWMQPGDRTFFKGAINAGGIQTPFTYATSRFVQDDNYISASSLSVFYRFSEKWNTRHRLSNTKITVYSGSLFTLSSIKRERGLAYPFSQSYTIQLQTSF